MESEKCSVKGAERGDGLARIVLKQQPRAIRKRNQVVDAVPRNARMLCRISQPPCILPEWLVRFAHPGPLLVALPLCGSPAQRAGNRTEMHGPVSALGRKQPVPS
jgi:hypothetical protein